MKTRFDNVADAAAHLAENPEVATQVSKEIRRNAIVRTLLQMRVDKGMTQEQVAKAMGCTPSTVSRIESGGDRQLKWTDIAGYVSALDVQMHILFDDKQ